ncbi:unnamed protein product [Owenia fusiformis]|uniref:Tetratricopeptide repeat protein 17 n=1 Tax=Owenia fusiformis TaxID=6347 RepID=A0A8S4N2E2_OWEFU|nr:unnamed protein product [Owenia fusiformis]
MTCDMPSMSYMALYIVSMHILNTNSRTSTHWKLNIEAGKVQSVTSTVADSELDDHQNSENNSDDRIFDILTNKKIIHGKWTIEGEDNECMQCEGKERNINTDEETYDHVNKKRSIKKTDQEPKISSSSVSAESTVHSTTSLSSVDHTLNCGKSVNFTKYDHLRGIASRDSHPLMPEPEVAMIFRKKGSKNSEVDMNYLESKLKKALKEKPLSPQILNKIGNFWRIKGQTQLSIECFRKALSLKPNNPDVLLNLGRVLFNLHYLEDAIFLTRESLDNQAAEQNPWLQHFTLGEILKAYGHFHEATLHFTHTLKLNPSFQPALAHLREMQAHPDSTVTYYTLFIILFLVMGVLCGILTSLDSTLEDFGESSKIQRHFNRAMAMKSMRQGINPRIVRNRKVNPII